MVSAGLEDPSPPELAKDYWHLAKIKGKMLTELLGGLLESAINSKSLHNLPKCYYKVIFFSSSQ